VVSERRGKAAVAVVAVVLTRNIRRSSAALAIHTQINSILISLVCTRSIVRSSLRVSDLIGDFVLHNLVVIELSLGFRIS
jgi:hypothetical protein